MQAQVRGQRPRGPEDEAVDEEPQAAEGAEVWQEGDELQQQPQRRVQRAEDDSDDEQFQEGTAVDARHEERGHEEAEGGKKEAEEGVHVQARIKF